MSAASHADGKALALYSGAGAGLESYAHVEGEEYATVTMPDGSEAGVSRQVRRVYCAVLLSPQMVHCLTRLLALYSGTGGGLGI